MPTSSMRRVGALLDLARFNVPKRVESDGNFRDWNVIVPAFLAMGAAALEAVYQLPPPRLRLAAEIVTRSLVDYTITFAWLAAPTDEDARAERLRSFEINDYNNRLAAHKKYAEFLPGKNDGAYDDKLFESGAMPDGILDAEMLARIDEVKAEPGAKGMPPLLDCAVQADSVWMKELDTVAQQPLANIYGIVFADFSFKAHSSLAATSSMVIGSPPIFMAGAPAPIGDDAMPVYGLACSLFTDMLLFASRRVGHPSEAAVLAAGATDLPRSTT